MPIPKCRNPKELNDYRPIALTSIIAKCFERIIRELILADLEDKLDPFQFAYQTNKSTEDAIISLVHLVLNHINVNPKDHYSKILFVDYSSAFNTIVPSTLVSKMSSLGIRSSLVKWIDSFLYSRGQHVRIATNVSHSLSENVQSYHIETFFSQNLFISTGCPQGCVNSPLLFMIYTNDLLSNINDSFLIKFADDTALVYNMKMSENNSQNKYLNEIHKLTEWCDQNKLLLNAKKTKEMVVKFSCGNPNLDSLVINGQTVERVDEFKYLGIQVDNRFSFSSHVDIKVTDARRKITLLRRARTFNISKKVLKNFCDSVVLGSLTYAICCYAGNLSVRDKSKINRLIKLCSKISSCNILSFDELYSKTVLKKTRKIIDNNVLPVCNFYSKLPSGRLSSVRTFANVFNNSFVPVSIRKFNGSFVRR